MTEKGQDGMTMIQEDGPWKVELWGGSGKVVLQSDDFTHDVTLVINGDFASDSQKIEYAEEIARRLNEWRAPIPPPIS